MHKPEKRLCKPFFSSASTASNEVCDRCGKANAFGAACTMAEDLEPRDPESGDLLRICAALNDASAPLLLRTKQTVREKDAIDRLFLERLLAPKHDSSG